MAKDKVDQARANMLKMVRTAIRLRHSIEADNELNEVLPKAEAAFNAAILAGEIPDPLDIVSALELSDANPA